MPRAYSRNEGARGCHSPSTALPLLGRMMLLSQALPSCKGEGWSQFFLPLNY